MNKNLNIYESYTNSKYLSIKHSSYFQVYEELLLKYVDKELVFVEIGVLNGGSLFMWRDFFGPNARIIGIDFNPIAKKWEEHGFEIFIGNQSDPMFWKEFFALVGSVDIILDDGGHTNEQQIVTSAICIPKINDGGMLIVEDTHASYLRSFGNPSKYSFINWAKSIVDRVNSRFPALEGQQNELSKIVYSLTFFESIVCFNVDRRKSFISSPTSNGGITSNAEDFRNFDSKVHRLSAFFVNFFVDPKKSNLRSRTVKRAVKWVNSKREKMTSAKMKKYF